LPYLTGYVALYAGDPKTAVSDLKAANVNDAFIQCLLGMAYEKLGDKAKATELYRKAASVWGHTPPAAFAHNFTQINFRRASVWQSEVQFQRQLQLTRCVE
jgi:Tfp pilus assembly protein PilF